MIKGSNRCGEFAKNAVERRKFSRCSKINFSAPQTLRPKILRPHAPVHVRIGHVLSWRKASNSLTRLGHTFFSPNRLFEAFLHNLVIKTYTAYLKFGRLYNTSFIKANNSLSFSNILLINVGYEYCLSINNLYSKVKYRYVNTYHSE